MEQSELIHAELDALSPISPEEQLATRAAWLYFVSGLTQAEIGKSLGINRIRVNRLLAQAREQGLVQIRITGRLAQCTELEERLKAKFKLQNAVVVPTPPDQLLIPQVIANIAGEVLSSRLVDGMSVGVGWGRTLRLSLRAVPHRPMRKISVISLLGGLTRGAAMNPYETASLLADLLGAQCYYIAAPALADTKSTKDVLMAQPMLKDVFKKGEKVDLAFISVGDLTPTGTMMRVGLVSKADVEGLKKRGAVGDICGRWIDDHGRVVDHPLNERVIALPPARLLDIPCVILASGGRSKSKAVLGALRGKLADILVTDEETALTVLRADKNGG